jgi:D-serine deaminase-like pyridoxal phosphate-dependent protein
MLDDDPGLVEQRAKIMTDGYPTYSKSLFKTGAIVGGNAANGVVSTPLMMLRRSALEHNVALLATYCREHGVELAPHAKTTMSPEIVRRQVAAGSWATTVANVSQAIALEDAVGERILIANEVVDAASIAWLSDTVLRGTTRVYCYVDSIEGVRRLTDGIAAGELDVLLEIGVDGGRCGVRTEEEALAVAKAVADSPRLRLAGVAAFEGLLASDYRDIHVARVAQGFLQHVHQIAAKIVAAVGFDEENPILTAGGSAFFDIVVEEFSRPIGTIKPKVVLRSGCYVSHDHGAVDRLSPFQSGPTRFKPAIEVLSTVISRPQENVAICDMGKRDVPFDYGLPRALWIRSGVNGTRRDATGIVVEKLNDQHAYLSLEREDVQVGDLISFGISHPCTAFDKWRVIPLVDDDLTILEFAQTRF